MKKHFLLLSALLFVVCTVRAQEEPQASKFENVSYYRMVKIDFKNGTLGRVNEIMKQYQAAGEKSGTPGPQIFWLMTGEYDVLFLWKLDGGTGDLEWNWSPDGIKWRNALIEVVGSAEKATELRKEWASLIQRSTSEIARSPNN